ncbi:transcriptional regulator [Streptococcus parauberis]|uniref:helix-turn-helix transcriptional regulator n=1 Tax=Streptococcus parauberis TaxID=1348 RepID=UPI00030F3AD8|nr:helix-turn-helix transcriptional regulator [Streptococcus parauberis]OHY31285.1 transcriptional regulator [Streptococcus parauberis]QBX18239.1 repressor [Streptococcus phage Javan407]QBX27394.1 repressor [Streptococcus phage Javan384]UWM90553.1 helix-turn-helix domain-containing protein [Streptococcus parauberis]
MQALLYKLRKEKKLSQEDMADIIHISKNQYGQKELGKAQFTQDEMFEIAKYFELPLSQIFLPRKSPKWKLKQLQK